AEGFCRTKKVARRLGVATRSGELTDTEEAVIDARKLCVIRVQPDAFLKICRRALVIGFVRRHFAESREGPRDAPLVPPLALHRERLLMQGNRPPVVALLARGPADTRDRLWEPERIVNGTEKRQRLFEKANLSLKIARVFCELAKRVECLC